MHHGEFRHPRLVEVYDVQCPWAEDDDAFLAIVDEVPASRVVDLGCGTGRFALGMARRGHRVTGVDPARASIDAALTKAGAELVAWVHGDSSTLEASAFDAAVMTSHVAQFFTEDDAWSDVLRDLYRALVPGGRLVFDTRDPEARAWERWNPTDSRHALVLGDSTHVEVWTEVTSVTGACVSFTHHYQFTEGELLSEATLRFRSPDEVRAQLSRAGFKVERMLGGWRGEPVGCGVGELLVIARR